MSASPKAEIDWPTLEAAQLDAANRHYAAKNRGTFEGDLVACRPGLRRTARQLFRNRHDADDAVQSVFVRALERREQFLGGCMACWLHRILTSVFCDQKRKSKKLVLIDDLASEDRTPVDNIPAPANPHTSLEVQEALEAIAARPDAGLLVHAGLGVSTEELAAQFDLSAANVRQTLSRGRRALREMLGGGV